MCYVINPGGEGSSLMTLDDKGRGLMHMMMSSYGSYLFRFSLTYVNIKARLQLLYGNDTRF
jgi:hypothetical protein